MIYNLGLFGINVSVEQIFRTLTGLINAVIYTLIDYLYDVFIYLSRAQILSNEYIIEIYHKVGMILGIFMIFKLMFSLIQSLVDPNKFTDKKNGFASIIFRCIISIVLLGFTPTIFKEAFKLQNLIVGSDNSNNVIYKLITSSSSSYKTSDMGRVIASDLYFSFYTDNESPFYRASSIDVLDFIDKSELTGQSYQRFHDNNFKNLKDTVTKGKNQAGIKVDFYDTVDYLALKSISEEYFIEYNWLLLLIAGCFVVWILAMYCIQVAVRVVQMAYLQLIAPVPILSYISDPEGSFKKWVNQCLSTYLDLFFRLAIIYFIINVIGDVVEQFELSSGIIFESTGISSSEGFTLVLVKVLIIIGLLLFAKKVPELLKDLFPNLGISSGKFSFGLNPKKEVVEPIKNIFNSTPVGWIPKGAGNIAKGAIGFVDRKIHNAPAPRSKFGQYMDKLMPERAKTIEANRQAKLDEKLREQRDKRGEKIANTARIMENGERKFDPEKAFTGYKSKEYINSFNEVKNAKKKMKEAETLVGNLDKALTAAYAMPTETEEQRIKRADAIKLARARKDAAVKNYSAEEAKYNLAKESHDSLKKQSQYSKFAKIEDDYKYYTDRYPDFVTLPKDISEVPPEYDGDEEEALNYGSSNDNSSNNTSEPEIIIPTSVREKPKEPSRFEERTRRQKETQAEINKETEKINEKINNKKDNLDDLLKQRIAYLQKTLAELISYKENVRDDKDMQELEKEIAKIKEELDKLFK